MIGTILSHYRIVDRLGKGGMGEVYRAEDTELRRDVALKVLPPDMAADPERLERFQREARAVAALNHPNIVTVHSVEEADGVHFITMELVEGTTLGSRIAEGGMPLAELFELAIPVAEALAAAHDGGITHRDLKPDNVMVDSKGRVKVLDFGLAKMAHETGATEDGTESATETAPLTGDGRVMGTMPYMSPEQIQGKPVDARSDIFSLGVILYEMASGRRPFAGGSSADLMASILRDTADRVTAVRSDVPRHLGRIVEHCLEKDPDRRFQTALDVRNELDELRREVESGEVEVASTPSGISPAPMREPSAFRRQVGPIAAIAVLGVAAVIWLFGRGSPAPFGTIDPGEGTGPVAVIGFENLGDAADTDQLSRMLVGLITTGLADSGGLELVSSAKVRSSLQQAGGPAAGFDPALAAKAARIAGARTMVVGQVMQSDELLLLTGELVDVASGNTLGSMRAEGTSKSDLFAMAGEIATQVSGQLGASRPEEGLAIDLAHSLTDSPEAYGLYVAGQVALNEMRFEDAVAQLTQAIRRDPTFALAYFKLGMARMWQGDTSGALRNLHNGLRYVDRLPPRWQTTYRAVIDYEGGDNVDSAYAALEKLTAQSPEMPEPYNYLGEILFHYSKYEDALRAKGLFARALEVDPTFKVVLYHLTDHLLLYDEVDKVRALLDRYRNDHDPSVIRLRSELLLHERRFSDIVALEQDRSIADSVRNLWSFRDSLLRTGHAERALELSSRDVEQSVGHEKGLALWLDAALNLRVGRFRRAIDDLSAASPLFDSPVMHSAGASMLLTHVRVLELLGDLDAAIDQARRASEMDYFHPRSRFEVARLLFATGRAAEGDREIAALEVLVQDSHSPHSTCWLELIRAERQRAQGKAEAALSQLRRDPPPVCQPIVGNVREQLAARAAEDAGKLEEALRHYQILTESRYRFESLGEIPALYEVARLEQRIGRLDDARRSYREFLDHWGDVDMPVPIVERAREQLAGLETE